MLGHSILFEVVRVEVELSVDMVLGLKLRNQTGDSIPLPRLVLFGFRRPLGVMFKLEENL